MNMYYKALADSMRGDEPRVVYAWVIITDHLAEEFGDETSDAGTAGPSTATDEQIALARLKGRIFKMYDDDGELYYTGKLWSDDYDSEEAMFGPLQDFGTPNAGATSIKWRTPTGQWEEA